MEHEYDENEVPLDEYWLRKTYPLASYIVALGISMAWQGLTGDTAVGAPKSAGTVGGIFGGFITAGGILSWFHGWRTLPVSYHMTAVGLNLMGVAAAFLMGHLLPEVGTRRLLLLGFLFLACAAHTGSRLLNGTYPKR